MLSILCTFLLHEINEKRNRDQYTKPGPLDKILKYG
jgi:hypothetical protein